MRIFKIFGFGIVLVAILLTLQAPPMLMAEDRDPPGRVARLSFLSGSISFQPGGEGDWVEAVRNRPLTTGDNLWADRDSRAEFQIGSTSVRVDSETSVTLLELDDRTTQLRLSQGSLIFRVRHLDDEDHFEIDTPNSAFVLQRTGEYRLDVTPDGNETDITVWRGRGEVTGGGSSYVVVAGQRARFSGTSELNHEIGQVPRRDDFDEFAFQRDEREDRAESANYISPEMTGYEDLDDYGHWRYVADYGPVWSPAGIAPGWAPYRVGHWVWIQPWGWTWVEDEPWGFAPFHYGRWAFVEDAWCWVPGPVVVRPVFAPAFVAFVGGGGFGPAVAWFPLAPHEVFVPWYRTSPVYVNNVNITNTRVNVTQVTNVYNTVINNNSTNVTHVTYVNQKIPRAITAVSHDTFVNARPVHNNLVRIDERQVAAAPVSRTLPLQPVRQSILGAGRPAAAKPPAPVMNRPVVATRTPTLPRGSFEQPPPTMNVRTETPQRPQPVVRPNQPPRPSEPPVRGTENARQPQMPAPNYPPESVPRPQNPRSEVGRPEPPMRPEPPRPQETPRPEERSVARPPGVESAHPLVRPAPPVQERPEWQRNEAQKFNSWQQQRESSVPRPAPPSPERPPEPGRPHR